MIFDNTYVNGLLSQVRLKYNIPVLKEQQLTCIISILNGQNSLCVLPTGYGKSLIYTLLPLIMDEHESDIKHVCYVVSPLKALMADQVKSMQARGIKAVALTAQTSKAESKAVSDGQVSVILGSPETFLKWIHKLADDEYVSVKPCAFVVDEAHNIVDWTTFRPIYNNLQEVKSIVASDPPWALFTATCDRELKLALVKATGLATLETVALVPDRPNIYLEISSSKGMAIEECFQHIVEDLEQMQENAPKTLIYCRSKDLTGQVYTFLLSKLREKAFIEKDGHKVRILEQFSSSYQGKDEERIFDRLITNDGSLRCIISTIALGMGVDVPNIERVVHWGVPDNVLRYWQEVGRAGRGGGAAVALLYAYPLSLPRANEAMRKMVRAALDGNCIRKQILEMLSLVAAPAQEDSIVKDSCKLNCNKCACPFCVCCKPCKQKCPCTIQNN